MLIVDVERVFHLDEMDDSGFALLTGDPRRCPTRQTVGAWRKHVRWNEVDRFCHRNAFLVSIHDKHDVGKVLHVLDTPQKLVELGDFFAL